MIKIGDILVSDDVLEVRFICDLDKCKGACCIEGDAGAPLEESEISLISDYIDQIKPYLTEKGADVIHTTGVFDYDEHGLFVTPLIDNRECAFINFRDGVAKCAIEEAYEKGDIPFRKPVSCHLYPIRISRLSSGEAVNYHKWHICKKALKLGNKLNEPLYRFLKDALIRKYGIQWYNTLESLAENKP